jgi:hypothetical protein
MSAHDTSVDTGVRYVKTLSAHLADVDVWYRHEARAIDSGFKKDDEERRRLLQALDAEYLSRQGMMFTVYEPSGEHTAIGCSMMRGAKAHRKNPAWLLPDGTMF